MTPRLLIVTDDALSASALRRALRATAAFTVFDGYTEGRAPCGDIVAALRPDVVLVDALRDHDALLARIREVRAALPTVKLITLAASMQPGLLAEAAGAGADGAIAKTARLERVCALIREVAAGTVFHAFTAAPAPLRRANGAAGDAPTLTQRELEVLRLVAAGAPNSRIAAQLWITEQTVKFHLSKVYRKLGVSNRTAASHHAYVHGLLETTPPVTGLAA
jgi:DNA-binding NarL/FixJ family response regulator